MAIFLMARSVKQERRLFQGPNANIAGTRDQSCLPVRSRKTVDCCSRGWWGPKMGRMRSIRGCIFQHGINGLRNRARFGQTGEHGAIADVASQREGWPLG